MPGVAGATRTGIKALWTTPERTRKPGSGGRVGGRRRLIWVGEAYRIGTATPFSNTLVPAKRTASGPAIVDPEVRPVPKMVISAPGDRVPRKPYWAASAIAPATGSGPAPRGVASDVRVLEDMFEVPEGRVKDAAAAVGTDPGEGEVVIGTVDAFGTEVDGAGVEGEQDTDAGAVEGAMLVDLVDDAEGGGQAAGDGVIGILDVDGDLVGPGMAIEVGADKISVFGPSIKGIGGAVGGGEATAVADEVEQVALLGVRNGEFAGGEEEEGIEVAEAGGGEDGGVFGSGDLPALRIEPGEDVAGCGDAAVTETGRVGEIEDTLGLASERRGEEGEAGEQARHAFSLRRFTRVRAQAFPLFRGG
jgi:hypothetical protein